MISYSQPLSRAFHNMKKALFYPFDITKWFRIGFTAWLASFTECNGSGGGSNNKSISHNDLSEFFEFPQTAWNWLTDNPLWANLIIVGLILLIATMSVLIWVSSRSKFMFLHNVVHDKSEISKPWHEYKKEGNSLFLFEFFYRWFAFAVFALFAAYCFVTARELYMEAPPQPAVFLAIMKMILLFIAYLGVFGYTSLFVKDFIVPIMYKHRVGIFRAWGKFLLIFGKRFFSFLFYGLIVFALGIGVAIAVIFFALITCCIGLFLIAIPFIGAVILLPVSYTFRAFSIEFLSQFGRDYDVFPQEGIEILSEEITD